MQQSGNDVPAGQYECAANYTEPRLELASAADLPGRVTAATCKFKVEPDLYCSLKLSSQISPDGLTVSNGAAVDERLLLKAAIFQVMCPEDGGCTRREAHLPRTCNQMCALLQLQDQYSNQVHQAGVHIRASLVLPDKLAGAEVDLPQLDIAAATRETNAQGCADFGDVSIAPGFIYPANSNSTYSLELELCFASTESSRYGLLLSWKHRAGNTLLALPFQE